MKFLFKKDNRQAFKPVFKVKSGRSWRFVSSPDLFKVRYKMGIRFKKRNYLLLISVINAIFAEGYYLPEWRNW